MTFIQALKRVSADARAATSVEYGLILALVFLAMVGGLSALGDEDTSLWGSVAGKATSAMSGS